MDAVYTHFSKEEVVETNMTAIFKRQLERHLKRLKNIEALVRLASWSAQTWCIEVPVCSMLYKVGGRGNKFQKTLVEQMESKCSDSWQRLDSLNVLSPYQKEI